MDLYWTAQINQIYNQLNKLEEKGLVKLDIQPEEKRCTRKVYKITEDGKKAFLNWVHECIRLIDERKREEKDE